MRDLKHLIFFENLLQEANNELVQQAVAEGKRALGYTCYYLPEVLMKLPGCFPVLLRAPRSSSSEMAAYYLTTRNCPYTRAILERALEGGYNFLSCLFGSETCAAMERMQEHFFLLNPVKQEDFFVTLLDAPLKDDKTSLDFYEDQLRLKVLEPMKEHFGTDISEEALKKAIEEHNELCRVMNAIGEFRKEDNPRITGYEFHVIQLVSECCPQEKILPYLKETLEELQTRQPEAKKWFRARVVLAGAEIDDPELTKLIEGCGAMVVADRYCYGSFPGREEIVIREGETAFRAICRHYLESNQCPRFMNTPKINARQAYVRKLVEDYKADGIIYESMKFCEFWSYERVLGNQVQGNEYGIPCCTIERDYPVGSAGQLRTRFQAFVESLEIKKLGGGKA